METGYRKPWKGLLQKLKGQTRICKICFKEFGPTNSFSLLHRDSCLCESCEAKLIPKFIEFKVDGCEGLAIYEYDDFIRSYLYQMKGCFDIELSKIFLERYYSELRIKYSGYYVVPVPSYIEDDEKRGFNHVIELFKPLNLNMLLILKKTSHFKQAEHSGNSRVNIEQFIELINSKELKNKNLLLVDDVFTTGSTIKACIKLLKQLKPRRIKVLVMSKTPFKKPLAQTN